MKIYCKAEQRGAGSTRKPFIDHLSESASANRAITGADDWILQQMHVKISRYLFGLIIISLSFYLLSSDMFSKTRKTKKEYKRNS